MFANFACVICDEKQESFLALQEHTRSHASTERRFVRHKVFNVKTQPTERIPCDVCSEIFDTPTKAISHKFKKHPNVSNSYFCMWCGKQFPIKYIYDKHTKSHNEPEPDKVIPCDFCDALFFNNDAAKYHTTYFHKKEFMLANYIQTPPASLKIVHGSDGNLMSAYYCQYCGHEYVVKFNLRQHIKRVHVKVIMNTPPENLIKCKLCNALFYTVEAYDFHTSFHTDSDLFVASEEARQQVISKIDQDFDMRRVRLCQEKKKPDNVAQMKIVSQIRQNMLNDIGNMSSLSPPPSDSDSDNEATIKEEQISDNNNPSSSAISIGEFFEMNKSVLGDCVQTNMDEVEIQGQELIKSGRSMRKRNNESYERDPLELDSVQKVKREKKNEQPKGKSKKKDVYNDEILSGENDTTTNSRRSPRMKSDVNSFINSSAGDKILSNKKYDSIKLVNIKVILERMDFSKLERNKPINKMDAKKLIAVKTLPKDIKNVKLLKSAPELKQNEILSQKLVNIKTEEQPLETVVKNQYSVVKIEPNLASNSNIKNNALNILPIKKAAIPKNLIPITTIPQHMKNVKMFRKVLVPKGVLKPGVKILTKKELEDLKQKGLILTDDAQIKDIMNSRKTVNNRKESKQMVNNCSGVLS